MYSIYLCTNFNRSFYESDIIERYSLNSLRGNIIDRYEKIFNSSRGNTICYHLKIESGKINNRQLSSYNPQELGILCIIGSGNRINSETTIIKVKRFNSTIFVSISNESISSGKKSSFIELYLMYLCSNLFSYSGVGLCSLSITSEICFNVSDICSVRTTI